VLLSVSVQTYDSKFVLGLSHIQTNRPEAMCVHRTNKQDKQTKKRGGRWRGGEDGTRWSTYEVKSGPIPSVKQLGEIVCRRQGRERQNTPKGTSHFYIMYHI